MLHINRSPTCRTNALSVQVHRAVDGDRRSVSSLGNVFFELLSRGADEESGKARKGGTPRDEDKIFVEAAPQVLRDLQDAVRNLPKGARQTPPITVGDETITIAETYAGVEILDRLSGECRTIPDMDFDGCVHVLALEINDHPQPICKQTPSVLQASSLPTRFWACHRICTRRFAGIW